MRILWRASSQLVVGLLMSLSWASCALAQSVFVIGSAAPSPGELELLERLRGELSSVGFQVTVRDRRPIPQPSDVSPEPWQQMLAAERDVAAAITVSEGAPVSVDVWILDASHRFQHLARVTAEDTPQNGSKRLAIRTSEVLRARLFETRAATGQKPGPRRSRSAAHPGSEGKSNRGHTLPSVGLELGVAALSSLNGVGLALLPTVSLDWAIARDLVLQATLAGFGTRPDVATSAGSALVSTNYGLLGACHYFDRWGPVRPLGALSLGVLRTGVTGRAALPRAGHSLEQWSFLLDASLGAAFELTRNYSLALAGHAQFAEPYVAIRFGDQQVASLGRPNLLLTLSLGVWP